MLLGGKVDDPARADQFVDFSDEHGASYDSARTARCFVLAKVIGKALLEQQGDALAHDANGVHSIYKGFRIGFE
jgi:hypothetical protein